MGFTESDSLTVVVQAFEIIMEHSFMWGTTFIANLSFSLNKHVRLVQTAPAHWRCCSIWDEDADFRPVNEPVGPIRTYFIIRNEKWVACVWYCWQSEQGHVCFDQGNIWTLLENLISNKLLASVLTLKKIIKLIRLKGGGVEKQLNEPVPEEIIKLMDCWWLKASARMQRPLDNGVRALSVVWERRRASAALQPPVCSWY